MLRARTLALAFTAAVAAAISAGCSVDHLSNGFVCNGSQDCPAGRTCSGGFCVVSGDGDGGVDAPTITDAPSGRLDAEVPDAHVPADAPSGCPAACTTCNVQHMTCEIDCGDGPQCQGTITCPTGWACNIDCASPNSCANIDCASDTSCTISCGGKDSCANITCGALPGAVGGTSCNVVCSGADSCATVDCANACACDVKCRPQASCGTLECPGGELCTLTNPDGCTSGGGGGGNGGLCDTCVGG